MDKAWVNVPRPLPAYRAGAKAFVASAMDKLGDPPKIQCPCTRCRNITFQTGDDVVSHLIMFGMDQTYNIWIFHGEERPASSSKVTCDRDEIPNPFVADCVNKIKEFNSSQVSPGNSLPMAEDALSITLGPERNGRVRGMGFGITPSKVGIHINSSKRVHVLESEISDLKKEMADMRSIYQKEMADMKNLLMQAMASMGNENFNTPSPHSQNGSSHFLGSTNLYARNERSNGDVGRKCKLLNWLKIAIAEATIESKDPNDMVHHIPLGTDAWKVWVNVPLDPKAPLYRPNSFMSVIEDAVGSTVAWHKDFISLD